MDKNGERKDDKKYLYPTEMKKLRACIKCGLIKTADQFKKDGCENCDKNYKGVTSHFKGIIAIMNPKKSFLSSKFQRGDKCKPGFYCIQLLDEADEGDMDIDRNLGEE